MKGFSIVRGAMSGKGSMLSCFGLSTIARSSLIPKKSLNAMFAMKGGGNAGRLINWTIEGESNRSTGGGDPGQRTPLKLSR